MESSLEVASKLQFPEAQKLDQKEMLFIIVNLNSSKLWMFFQC